MDDGEHVVRSMPTVPLHALAWENLPGSVQDTVSKQIEGISSAVAAGLGNAQFETFVAGHNPRGALRQALDSSNLAESLENAIPIHQNSGESADTE